MVLHHPCVTSSGSCNFPNPFTQNPLRFSFPPDLNAEALMQGAEQLSAAVVRSGIALSPSFLL